MSSESVLILGAGCFGLATAHHLASNGHKNITVLEKGQSVPSSFSAAYDLNKVIRAEYADPFYTDLSLVCRSQGPGPNSQPELFIVSDTTPSRMPSGNGNQTPSISLTTTRLAFLMSHQKPPQSPLSAWFLATSPPLNRIPHLTV
jgi:shikimate 5-dehydrogenase